MDKTRTLPPQVRGRVTGVLDLFVDEIRLFRNIFFLENNFDLVLQVQWWGEILPVFIRPREVKVGGTANKNSHLLESYYYSAKYDIKTTLDLFKLYLKNCEVLELSVLEAFENYVIGSAFLKDLIELLNNNNELHRMPILDYLGEEIGELIIHTHILWKPKEENSTNLNKNTQILKNNFIDDMSDKQDCIISNKIKRDCFTLGDKTLIYDSHSKKKFEMEQGVKNKSSENLYHLSKNNKISNSNVTALTSETSSSLFNKQKSSINSKNIPVIKDYTCLPEIKILSDSSKVLYFGSNCQKSTHKADARKPNSKVTNKFNSNMIKCKTKSVGKLTTKKPVTSKNLVRDSVVHKKHKQCDTITSHVIIKPGNRLSNESGNSKDVPSKEKDIKVLDYLLGSDMSKQDEETALNDFKKMSPSHNLVDSINELCLTSDYKTKNPVIMYNTSAKEPNFNFDLNNPIERSYYQRFFLKSKFPGDFEIAEFLNEPKNGFMLDGLKSNKVTQPKNESPSSSFKSLSKLSFPEAEVKEKILLESESVSGKKNSCSRCKYYKKLNELDTIIESLKHFEQKMQLHEKDLQSSINKNCDIVIKRNHFVKES